MDRLWTISRVELRLTDDEFWHLSYRQFALLHERYLALRWQDQWQQGAVIAAICNNGMRSYDKPPEADDFIFTIVPGQKQIPTRVPRKRMTGARAIKIFDLFKSVSLKHESLCPDQST